MRLARRRPPEEGGSATPLGGMEDTSALEREKNGGRECFWLFLFTKEQRREGMDGRTDA